VTLEAKKAPVSRQEITDWLISWITKELGVSAEEINVGDALQQYSLSSLTATILAGDLEDWLQLRLSPTLVWDYPSIDALVDYLERATAASGAVSEPAPGAGRIFDPAEDARQLLEGLDQLSDHDIDALLSQLVSSEQDEAPVVSPGAG
jgi:acyl carrier protein